MGRVPSLLDRYAGGMDIGGWLPVVIIFGIPLAIAYRMANRDDDKTTKGDPEEHDDPTSYWGM